MGKNTDELEDKLINLPKLRCKPRKGWGQKRQTENSRAVGKHK